MHITRRWWRSSAKRRRRERERELYCINIFQTDDKIQISATIIEWRNSRLSSRSRYAAEAPPVAPLRWRAGSRSRWCARMPRGTDTPTARRAPRPRCAPPHAAAQTSRGPPGLARDPTCSQSGHACTRRLRSQNCTGECVHTQARRRKRGIRG